MLYSRVRLHVQKQVNSRLQHNIEAEKKAGEEKLKRELGALKEQQQVIPVCSKCQVLPFYNIHV